MTTKLTLFAALIILVISCEQEKEEPIPEVPPGVIRTDTTPVLHARIVELFPSSTNATVTLPHLFSDTVQKNIVLNQETEVYLMFIAERATYRNTVGWYSYTKGNPPKNAGDVARNVLFPNASGAGTGGELKQGDMIQLGTTKFPKGTVIGFFLIINGWQDGFINYNGITHFTDYALNNEGRQQHVLFKEKNGGDIVLGFEDMLFKQADADYNDLLFTVTDNRDALEPVSFDETKIPKL